MLLPGTESVSRYLYFYHSHIDAIINLMDSYVCLLLLLWLPVKVEGFTECKHTCGGVSEQIQVEGKGKFHINPGCTARFDHYKFENTDGRNSFAKRIENLPQMLIPYELITKHPEIFHISTLDPTLEGISIKTYMIINATIASYILALAMGYHIYYIWNNISGQARQTISRFQNNPLHKWNTSRKDGNYDRMHCFHDHLHTIQHPDGRNLGNRQQIRPHTNISPHKQTGQEGRRRHASQIPAMEGGGRGAQLQNGDQRSRSNLTNVRQLPSKPTRICSSCNERTYSGRVQHPQEKTNTDRRTATGKVWIILSWQRYKGENYKTHSEIQTNMIRIPSRCRISQICQAQNHLDRQIAAKPKTKILASSQAGRSWKADKFTWEGRHNQQLGRRLGNQCCSSVKESWSSKQSHWATSAWSDLRYDYTTRPPKAKFRLCLDLRPTNSVTKADVATLGCSCNSCNSQAEMSDHPLISWMVSFK